MSFSDRFAKVYKRLLPSPFSIAILLTFLTFTLALLFTKPVDTSYGSYTIDLLKSWEAGLWREGNGGLYFAFQMMLMLVLGHIMALSKPLSQLIDRLTLPCTSTANTALVVTFSTVLVSLFNWGLGLIFGAILARKVGEKFSRENRTLNYPLIGAAAYSGLMVWHGGLSGSAPIKAHEEGNLPDLVSGMNVDLASIPSRVDMSETIFSSMNITVSLLLLIGLPLIMYYFGKREKDFNDLPKPTSISTENTEDHEGAERIDHSSTFRLPDWYYHILLRHLQGIY
jgi:short-chain fatty acids transporter